MRGLSTDQTAYDKALPDHRDDRGSAPYFLGRDVPGVRGAGPGDPGARQPPGCDGAVRRGKLYTALFLVGVALGLVVVCIGRADAADPQHDYRATWDRNDPSERVNRYRVEGASDTGNIYTADSAGDPPPPEATLPIIEPIGTEMTFHVKACRDDITGEPASERVCSEWSEPVTLTHPPAEPTPPSGLQVIRVTVEVIR